MYKTAEHHAGSDHVPRKRKLKRPRATKACQFCRKRKVRCSGTHPCDYCTKEEAVCEYDGPIPNPRRMSQTSTSSSNPITGLQRISVSSLPDQHTSAAGESTSKNSSYIGARQHDLPMTGVSFLYQMLEQAGGILREPIAARLVSYGDQPAPGPGPTTPIRAAPNAEDFKLLYERYFRFCSPTYRFLHEPTIQNWAKMFLASDLAPRRASDTTGGRSLSIAQEACVIMPCAHALLYTTCGDRYQNGGDDDLKLSRHWCARVQKLLEHESGPPTVISVQARLAVCIYLMGTFRINECRYAFGFLATIIQSLGLHHKSCLSSGDGFLENECRKRAFWSAYNLDAFLSVMLGRPRIFREEDIDMPLPLNIDDEHLTTAESSNEIPHHGNLDACIAQIEAARLMARTSDRLYPLKQLKEEEIVNRSLELLDDIEHWAQNLPNFLKPRPKTMTGEKTLERQYTLIKLSHAHLCVIAARRCLLPEFNRLGQKQTDPKATGPVLHLIENLTVIIDVIHEFIQTDTFHQSFWIVQYIGLVGISTFYSFAVQYARDGLPPGTKERVTQDIRHYFDKAQYCQQYLSSISPLESQAKRHLVLLDQLRNRVGRDFERIKYQQVDTNLQRTNTYAKDAVAGFKTGDGNYTVGSLQYPQSFLSTEQTILQTASMPPAQSVPYVMSTNKIAANFDMMQSQHQTSDMNLTPSSEISAPLPPEFGWESFDTLGIPMIDHYGHYVPPGSGYQGGVN